MSETSVDKGGRGEQSKDDREDLADLLTDPHCRLLLEYLHQQNGPASVSAATRYIVTEITGTKPVDDADSASRRVQTWLHLGQLPVLDEHGIVDFDPETGTVALHEDSAG